jgi:hypothetical protein
MSPSIRASSCCTSSQMPPSSDAQHRLGVARPGVGAREHDLQFVDAGRDAVGIGPLEQQESRHGMRVGRRRDRAQVGVKAADGVKQDQRLAVCRSALRARQGDAQHPQDHVGDLDLAAGVQEAARFVAEHRA